MDFGLMREMGLMATDAQLELIDSLLDQVDAPLTDYTDTVPEELTKQEASEVIDSIKEDVFFMGVGQ